MFKLKTVIFTMLILSLAFVVSHNALAIGLVSKPLVIDNAIRGEVFEDALDAFNSEDYDAAFELSTNGDIAEWVAYYSTEDLENPIDQIDAPSKEYVRAMVRISVPKDIPNGLYEGQLIITLRPLDEEDSETTRASVNQRLSRPVSLNVTDNEDPRLLASVIPGTYDIKDNQPLNIRLIYTNEGNVRLSPQIDFKIYAEDNTVISSVIYPYPDGETPILSGERREIAPLVVSTTDLKDGKYRAELRFQHKGEVIFTKDFKFNVGNPGRVLGSLNINYQIFWPLIAVLAVIIAIIAVIFASRKAKLSAHKH